MLTARNMSGHQLNHNLYASLRKQKELSNRINLLQIEK